MVCRHLNGVARFHGVGAEAAEVTGDLTAVGDGSRLKTGQTVTLELALRKGAGVVNGTNANAIVEIGMWKEICVVIREMSVITGQTYSAQKRSLVQIAYNKNLRHRARRYRLLPLHRPPRLLDPFQIGTKV